MCMSATITGFEAKKLFLELFSMSFFKIGDGWHGLRAGYSFVRD